MNGKRYFSIYVVVFICLLLTGCGVGKPERDADLNKAVSFVHYLTSKRFLNRSSFALLHKDKTPTRFVSYLFSTMGSAEWVVTGDPFEEEQMKSIGIPIPAANVAITNKYIKGVKKQIVLNGNDEAGTVVVKAYLDQPEPQFIEHIDFNFK